MIDLKDLLDERSANPPTLTGMRSASVAQRIEIRRRRLAAGAVTASFVVVLLALVGYGVPRLTSAPPIPPAASPSARTIEGFPEYSNGARVVAAAHGDIRSGTVSLTWIPPPWT